MLITIVSVAAFYNFLAIKNNEAFISISERFRAANTASISCEFILVCTVIYFIFNADKFFMLNRQKETALYMLMGITQSKISQVFAIESLFIGTVSIFSGLAFGIILSKLFFMLLAKSIFLNVEIPFKISLNSIFTVILVFSCIFAAIGYKKYRVVKKSKLIDMINAAKEKEDLPKLRYFKGILGVLLILAGYIVGIMIKRWEFDLLISSMTALLCAAAITAFGASLSFKEVEKREAIKESPYSFSYESYDEKSKEKAAVFIASATTLAYPFNVVKKEIEINNREYVIKAQEDAPFTGIIDKLGTKNVYVLGDNEYEKVKEGFMDKDQYVTLKKIGMSKEEIKKSVYVQVAISFVLPGSAAILHSIIAMKMLEQVMNFSFNLQLIILVETRRTLYLLYKTKRDWKRSSRVFIQI